MKSDTEHRKTINGDTDTRNIPLAEISTDKTQTRARIDEATVEEYAELMDNDVEFPPVVVFGDDMKYWLADGFHRYCAAQSRGVESITCEVRQGGERDAIKYSFSANTQHGLRRTNEDKRRAVEIALRDEEWGQLGPNSIADLCGVSSQFVRNLQDTIQVPTVGISGATLPVKKTGRDGKRYPVKKKRRTASQRDCDTSHNEATVEVATNGAKPSKNGAQVVSEKDVQNALNLLAELGTVMETLGLHDKYCAYLEDMTVCIEELQFCESSVHPASTSLPTAASRANRGGRQ